VSVSVPAPAPAPAAPATDRTVLREIVDGDTLVILYTNGTFRLYNTAPATV
jgi:hypothetical protein